MLIPVLSCPVTYLFGKQLACTTPVFGPQAPHFEIDGVQRGSTVRKFCDVHIAANMQKGMLSLIEKDITGMIACGLCQHGAGDLHALRSILRDIFTSDLQICYDVPPREFVRHRENVYDLYLPWPKPQQHKQKTSTCITAMKRYVLCNMLNADISEPEIIHFCALGCCRDPQHTMQKMTTWVTWALISQKTPRYVRGKWLQQSPCLNWCGLLEAHHNLLPRVLMKFTGCPQAPVAPTVESSASAAGALGWEFFADHDGSGPVSSLSVPDMANSSDAAEAYDEEAMDAPTGADGSGPAAADGDEWARRNKQYKHKCGMWSQTRPGARLAVVANVLNCTTRLLFAFLHISSDEWERQQVRKEASGDKRSFRMLEAAKDEHTLACMRSLGELLDTVPPGVPHNSMTGRIRNLAFRLISRAGCAMHLLIHKVRQGEPYRTFLCLAGEDAADAESHACMQDEFATEFARRFEAGTARAKAVLESVARQVDVDIAQLESKHSSIRRMVHTRNVHTWVPLFQTIAAEKLCHDVVSQEDKWRRAGQQEDEPQTEQEQKITDDTQKKRRKIGGGAWRVFVHIQHAGARKRFTREGIQSLVEAYRNLSVSEREYYEHLGKLAHISWLHGNRPFPAPARRDPSQQRELQDEQMLPAGAVRSDGVIVAADSDDALRKLSFMAFAVREFDEDIKQIRRSHRQAAQNERQQEEQLWSVDLQGTRRALEVAPQLFEGAPAQHVFASGTCGTGNVSAALTWSPPVSTMAKATFCSVRNLWIACVLRRGPGLYLYSHTLLNGCRPCPFIGLFLSSRLTFVQCEVLYLKAHGT